jgi:hypothetical protein
MSRTLVPNTLSLFAQATNLYTSAKDLVCNVLLNVSIWHRNDEVHHVFVREPRVCIAGHHVPRLRNNQR